MKKNALALVSIALNLVLLASVVYLGGKLENTEQVLKSHVENAESMILTSVDNIGWQVEQAVEEATKLVAEYTLEPVAVDKENRALEMNLRLQLRQWSADAVVDVIVTAGADTCITRLPIDTAGGCSGKLSFPVENGTEVELSAAITMNGVTTREDLCGWGEITQMLPIMLGSWGGTVPEYKEGHVQQESYQIYLDGGGRWDITVKDLAFRLYVNDRLEQTVPGDTEEDGAQIQHAVSMTEPLTAPCQPGDTVRLTLVCEDEFGLGYEFNLGIWGVPSEEGELEELPLEMETRATLIWD